MHHQNLGSNRGDSVAYLWCVVQSFPKHLSCVPGLRHTDEVFALRL